MTSPADNGRGRPRKAAPHTSTTYHPPPIVADGCDNWEAFSVLEELPCTSLPREAHDHPWLTVPFARLELEHRNGRRLVVHVSVAPEAIEP